MDDVTKNKIRSLFAVAKPNKSTKYKQASSPCIKISGNENVIGEKITIKKESPSFLIISVLIFSLFLILSLCTFFFAKLL